MEWAGAIYGVGQSAASAWKWATSPGGEITGKKYNVGLSLLELALIALKYDGKSEKVKLAFDEYALSEVPYDFKARLTRTGMNFISMNPQRRDRNKAIVYIAVHALRCYRAEPTESIKLLFRRAITGLICCKKTYEENPSQKAASIVACGNFDTAIEIFKRIISSEDQSEKVEDLVRKQEHDVGVTSEKFWERVDKDEGTVDLLEPLVQQVDNLFKLKGVKDERNTYAREIEALEESLARYKATYIEEMSK